MKSEGITKSKPGRFAPHPEMHFIPQAVRFGVLFGTRRAGCVAKLGSAAGGGTRLQVGGIWSWGPYWGLQLDAAAGSELGARGWMGATPSWGS